jgi:hypothetical protein
MYAGYRKGKSSYYKSLVNGQMKRLSKLPLVKPRTQRHQVTIIRTELEKAEHMYKGSNYRSIRMESDREELHG